MINVCGGKNRPNCYYICTFTCMHDCTNLFLQLYSRRVTFLNACVGNTFSDPVRKCYREWILHHISINYPGVPPPPSLQPEDNALRVLVLGEIGRWVYCTSPLACCTCVYFHLPVLSTYHCVCISYIIYVLPSLQCPLRGLSTMTSTSPCTWSCQIVSTFMYSLIVHNLEDSSSHSEGKTVVP